MLRNTLCVQCVCRSLLTTSGARNKSSNANSIARQSKVLSKLFGNRIAGSKKRWYPSNDANANGQPAPASVIFQASQFGKSGERHAGAGKNTTRRMTVLNKLFMTHITDLLATGEASEAILGRGMQVTRVKITSDFACINVYWLSTGDAAADVELETELQQCSGRLRHELSQLQLMGEVPRIKFVRDKKGGNLNQVESILRGIDFEQLAEQELAAAETAMEHDADTVKPSYAGFDIAQTVRREFYDGAEQPKALSDELSPTPATDLQLPEMRHDVFGLDHRDIMSKIITKMRKSQQAWDKHKNPEQHTNVNESETTTMTEIAQMQSKLEDSSDKFNAFLAKRRVRKETPERKKHQRDDIVEDWSMTAHANVDDVSLLSRQQRRRYIEEDYIIEEQQHDKTAK